VVWGSDGSRGAECGQRDSGAHLDGMCVCVRERERDNGQNEFERGQRF
jgi:hypothetical protein